MNSAKMDPALVASSAPKEIQISELNAAADLLGNDALDEDFREAVNYIMTNADAGSHLSEEQQERLYGLFRVATATKKAPAEFDAERYEHKEQWKAHVAVGDLSKEQAKLMYCDLIATAIPSFLMRDDDEMTSDGENEPAMERESCPEDNGSDLHAIISSGNLSQVQEYLTKRGQDINLRDGRGLTPLMVVIMYTRQQNISAEAVTCPICGVHACTLNVRFAISAALHVVFKHEQGFRNRESQC
eukprot:m.63521 g.63521  ORF g.63521 m.63521 type:complete len:244 (-) comp15840_c2_seq3:596-1327(-)